MVAEKGNLIVFCNSIVGETGVEGVLLLLVGLGTCSDLGKGFVCLLKVLFSDYGLRSILAARQINLGAVDCRFVVGTILKFGRIRGYWERGIFECELCCPILPLKLLWLVLSWMIPASGMSKSSEICLLKRMLKRF